MRTSVREKGSIFKQFVSNVEIEGEVSCSKDCKVMEGVEDFLKSH